MHRAKKIALWGLGVLLSSAVLGFVFLATAGDDFYRWAMRQVIEDAVDREVRVDGTFSFQLGWQPTLIVTDIWLEDADWTERREMVRADRVEIQVALAPLFSGILRVPRLVVEGVDVELELSADQRRNWDIGRPGRSVGAEELENAVYPLFDFISLTDINITYREEETGRQIIVQLDYLKKLDEGGDKAPYALSAEGHVNERPFKVAAQIGSIEDAIAALAPYPLEVEVQSQNFSLELSGTVDNLPNARGLDVNLMFRSHSVYEMLQTLQIEGEFFGPAAASARLRGDLASLAVDEIDLTIVAPSGEELKAEGRIANVIEGEGLELQFAGKIDPESLKAAAESSPAAASIIDGLTDLRAAGHLTGDLDRLALQNLSLRLEHISGAEATVEGAAKADLFGDEMALQEFSASAVVFLPDESIIDDALETHIPPLTDLEATAELSWNGDWIEVKSATVKGKALSNVALSGTGRLGRLTGSDFSFETDVRMELKGSTPDTRPIFYLIEGFSPSKWREVKPPADATQASAELVFEIQRELIDAGLDPGAPDGLMGPITRSAIEEYQRANGLSVDGRPTRALLQHLEGTESAEAEPPGRPKMIPTFPLTEALPDFGATAATMRLLFKDDVFRFEDLNLKLGENGTEIKTVGFLGRLPQGPDGLLTQIDMEVRVHTPSSKRFGDILPPEVPEFTDINGRFKVTGHEEQMILSAVELTATGPQGLAVKLGSEPGQLELNGDFEVQNLLLAVSADWPDTQSLYDFVEQDLPDVELPDFDLPELGPVRARGVVKDSGGTFALSEIDAAAGDPEKPKFHVAGSLADVTALTGVDLEGDFDLATVLLLRNRRETEDADLGVLRGEFQLSDSDGSLGLELLTAGLEDARLLALSVEGLFDDIKEGDEIRLATHLEIPNLEALGRKLGFDAENLTSLSYFGEVSGSDESFTMKGEATLGETELIGHYTGSLTGDRPSLKGEISSPLVRLEDLGMVPDERTLTEILDELETQPEPPAEEWIFDETPIPFDALKAIDLDLDVVLKDVEGVRIDIDQISAKVVLVDGELNVDPLTFDFVSGEAEAKLYANAREDRPQLHVEFNANNVSLENLLSQAQVEVPLDGTMDVILDLTAEGETPRALASSLNGNTQLAIADGHVLTGLLTLTTTNPVSWLFTKSARQGYSKMNCLIMRFEIEDGLAESRALVLDTPNMLAQGTGQVDLRNETLNISVSPRAKQRRLIPLSTPFSIQGRLSDPSINVSATGTTLRTGGEVLLSPLNLLGSLLPFVGSGSRGDDNPCLTLKDAPPTE